MRLGDRIGATHPTAVNTDGIGAQTRRHGDLIEEFSVERADLPVHLTR